MSERGFARSQADWIVGINLTRAYTIIARQNNFEGILSVGRVQTPILGLVVARDKEFESFKSIVIIPYLEILKLTIIQFKHD